MFSLFSFTKELKNKSIVIIYMSKIDIDKLKQMLADEEDRQIPLTKQKKRHHNQNLYKKKNQ